MTAELQTQISQSKAITKKRYAYVGTGSRVNMFLDPVATRFREDSEIVGLCDSCLSRARFHQERLQTQYDYAEVPVYPASSFDKMLQETRPDCVVVCTPDGDHHRYILEALTAGLDVVTEKPMTINATCCQEILDTAEKSPGTMQVAFNYRWAPGATAVKQLLDSGVIGKVFQVNMEYLLNTSHGADYFRRWHAEKDISGGLLVHKSTHHFDLINWWIDSIPETVFALGGLYFYGRENAYHRGDGHLTGYPRYHGNVTHAEDPFAFIYDDADEDQVYNRRLYLDGEEESGYLRDRNVFGDHVSIEDVMNVMISYRTGVLLNYSLNAFSPKEGYRVSFTGERGRVEYVEEHQPDILEADGERKPLSEHAKGGEHRLIVYPHFKKSYGVSIPEAEGGHWGADPYIQEQIFSQNPPEDPWGRHAGHEQGAASILAGIAANESMVTGQSVRVSSLVRLHPDVVNLSALT